MPSVTTIPVSSRRMRPMVQPYPEAFRYALVDWRGFLPRTCPPVPGGVTTGGAA
jgi:hypothetical protein